MISVGKIHGMTVEDEAFFRELLKEFNNHESKNAEKQRYYEGAIRLSEVNLGIALPNNILGLEIGCEWGAKAVDVLASRSMFDGYVGKDGGTADQIKAIADRNALVSGYMKACKDELKFGCAFATLSKDMLGNSKIRFHSPMTAPARWNGELGRIDGGFAIVAFDQRTGHEHKPVVINFYTDNMIYVMERVIDTDEFSCVAYPGTEGNLQAGLPRQVDASLLLEVDDGTSVQKTFALGEYIISSGYDWTAEELEDMTVTLDYQITYVKITVSGWDKEYFYNIIL